MNICSLCLKNKPLEQSHIIPSFVGNWLKKTSVTGYLRQAVKPNLRRQDILKQTLLCGDCELLLSKDEQKFAENIFTPYVETELNEWGVAQGKLKTLKYNSWLLRFVIGLQWKSLITHEEIAEDIPTIRNFDQVVSEALKIWSDFLLNNRDDTGEQRHHIVFLQNLMTGNGYLPQNINDRVNFYLLRSVDSTLALSPKTLFLFSKLGPIVIISGLKPARIEKMNDSIIRLKGHMPLAQNLRNTLINDFIFITRPNEAFKEYNLSEKQLRLIDSDVRSKIKYSKNQHEIKAAYSDNLMHERNR